MGWAIHYGSISATNVSFHAKPERNIENLGPCWAIVGKYYARESTNNKREYQKTTNARHVGVREKIV